MVNSARFAVTARPRYRRLWPQYGGSESSNREEPDIRMGTFSKGRKYASSIELSIW